MKDDGMASRIGSGISAPIAILLLIFFFLPWVNLTCAGAPLGQASGWQLTRGDMSPAESLPKGAEAKEDKDKKDSPKARPWFILGLVVPIILLLAGAAGFAGKLPPVVAGRILLLLGLVGIVVVILAANVDYTDEMIDRQKASKPAPSQGALAAGPETEQMEKELRKTLKTEGTGILWVCLVLYVLVVLCGVANLALPKLSAAPSAAQPAPAPPADPPPTQP